MSKYTLVSDSDNKNLKAYFFELSLTVITVQSQNPQKSSTNLRQKSFMLKKFLHDIKSTKSTQIKNPQSFNYKNKSHCQFH